MGAGQVMGAGQDSQLYIVRTITKSDILGFVVTYIYILW